MRAWDRVDWAPPWTDQRHAGLHQKRKKVIKEPVYELYRHGIVHGMVVDFDNEIVATKAWNYLFAVVDWAEDKKKQETPAPPAPTWRGARTRSDAERRRPARP